MDISRRPIGPAELNYMAGRHTVPPNPQVKDFASQHMAARGDGEKAARLTESEMLANLAKNELAPHRRGAKTLIVDLGILTPGEADECVRDLPETLCEALVKRLVASRDSGNCVFDTMTEFLENINDDRP